MRAVLYDWGGVLMRTGNHGFRHALDARLGLAPGGLEQLVFGCVEWKQAQLGQMSEEAVWAALGARWSLGPDALTQMRRDFWAGDQLDGELVAFIRSVRPHVKAGLLSNFASSLRGLLIECGVLDAFDAVVISGEEGVLKPEARIYHIAAERLGTPLSECLFVDDSIENIEGARRAGMQTFHFAPVEGALTRLRAGLAQRTSTSA
jgi:HAD superfamily hydrolase (TIGR01549 family)